MAFLVDDLNEVLFTCRGERAPIPLALVKMVKLLQQPRAAAEARLDHRGLGQLGEARGVLAHAAN